MSALAAPLGETEKQQLSAYSPPNVWQWNKASGGKFASINRPVSGATSDKALQVGKHPFQLYSLATPNGVKVTVMLEELLHAGVRDAEYDAWFVDIMAGDQFGSGFVEANPNSKIPTLVDRSNPHKAQRVFESGAILQHLAEKFGMFMGETPEEKAECRNWLFWQMGSAPYLGGGFGHFFAYAPVKIEYAIDRFAMETKRQLDVLDQHLATHTYMAGDRYTIADMAIWPWYGALVQNKVYEAAEFLAAHEYKHVLRWTELIALRPAVIRGRMVNKSWGEDKSQCLKERHDASDFDTQTEDKLEAAKALAAEVEAGAI